MKIRALMHKPPRTCAGTTTLAEAARQMMAEDVGALIVISGDRTPEGIVTDRDLALRGYSRGLAADAKVAEVMTRAIVTIEADSDVFEAAATMAARGVRRLPVIDDETVIGVIALDDLTQLLGKEAGELSRAIEAQSDPRHYAGWTSWDAG